MVSKESISFRRVYYLSRSRILALGAQDQPEGHPIGTAFSALKRRVYESRDSYSLLSPFKSKAWVGKEELNPPPLILQAIMLLRGEKRISL
jgi:hypothetical protein